MADESEHDDVDLGRPNPTRCPVWPIVIGLFCLLAILPIANFMLHALWMSGHPVEGGGERGAAWGRRATVWFGVLVVLVAGLGWSVWRVERWWRVRAERG